MKLAEALIERADLKKKIAQIRARMAQNAKVQEGEQPAESVEELLGLFSAMMDELESIVKRINRTNGATMLDGGSISDAIAERDNLKGRISAYREIYDAAAIRQERFSRSEIKYKRCVDPSELQRQIDAMAKSFREIDTRIQETNWTTELLE